jgi:eukaryotic-like serine/threonine-protein kinase
MGKVYAARHLRLPRRAAVKVLQPEFAGHPEVLRRFQREAEIASALGNRHIVQVFDVGELPGGAPFILMELLEGKDLSLHLAEQGRLDPTEVIALLDQAAAGLTAAHAGNVVHRDIKPANLFLAREAGGGEVLKILDFGLSKVRGASLALTGANAVGTPAYMSPEQLRASDEVDHRTDVYALGVTLFELLTGERPFDDPSVTRLCEHIITDPPPPASSRRQALTSAVDAVIARALTKDANARYPTVAAFWSEARQALLACAAQMPPLEAAATPVFSSGDPTSKLPGAIAATFISGPRPPVPQSARPATAKLQDELLEPALAPTRPEPEPRRAAVEVNPRSSEELRLPRRRWPGLAALMGTLAFAALVWALLARPDAKPQPTESPMPRQQVTAAKPVADPPKTEPTPPAPKAPVAIQASPQVNPTPKPTRSHPRPSRRGQGDAHGQPTKTDALIGADSIEN